MSNKNYPTRMHEQLGVEPNEANSILYEGDICKFIIDEKAMVYGQREGELHVFSNPEFIVYLINHPDRIIRRPRVTEEQLYALEAVYRLFGMKWLTMGPTGYAYFSVDKPEKRSNGWIVNRMLGEPMCTNTIRADLSSLVSWSDPEPLDIVQTLKANGVEIDNA